MRSGRSVKDQNLKFSIFWHAGQSKRPLWWDKHGHYFLYNIFYSIYNPFITTLRMAAELDIPVVINLSNRIIAK